MRAAVLGATGTIGRALVQDLARSHEVVAISRSGSTPAEHRVTPVALDVADRAALAAALEDVEVVYHLVHSLGADDFEQRDRDAADSVAAAAGSAGARQIVYLGGLGDDAESLSAHLRSRAETAERLRRGTVPVTTLRAAMIVGPGSAAFETIVALVERLPGMICPRWVSVPTQPVALDDVVRYLVEIGGLEEAYGEQFDVGGPDVMTYREMMERIAGMLGRRPLIVEVPVLTPRLSSLWLHLVTPVQASVARPLVEGMRSATVVRDHRIRALVPFEPTPFEVAVRSALTARVAG
ncbi:MAG: hypothetical protein QOK22_1283 [Gaiellaceae bacterium]|nr:hypothetical protein [Gaiellaceae bacterium]